jgi:hypothetical protein
LFQHFIILIHSAIGYMTPVQKMAEFGKGGLKYVQVYRATTYIDIENVKES